MNAETTARLAELRKELTTVLEARMSELLSLVRETEQETRQIVSTELDIARHERLRERLTQEHERLERKALELMSKVEAQREQNEDLKAAVSRLENLLSDSHPSST